MCLIFLSINQHPTYSLIVAANRDEFYERKTAPADFWKDHPHILGGRDLEAGGTWMAIAKSGKISLITNYRDLKNLKSKAPSRGHLVSDYLIEKTDPKNYLKGIEPNKGQYNGFNLIVGSPKELWYLSNYKSGVEKITSGVHGLSNALMLRPVLEHNAEAARELYAELAPILDPALEQVGSQAQAKGFIDNVCTLAADTGVSLRLRDHGIPEAEIPTLAREAMKQTRLLVNNPCPIEETDAQRLYEAAW